MGKKSKKKEEGNFLPSDSVAQKQAAALTPVKWDQRAEWTPIEPGVAL